jgi:hypothetical protein
MEARPRGGWGTELSHEWLGAVVPGSDGDLAVIAKKREVVSMDTINSESD